MRASSRFAARDAQRWYDELKAQNCITDVRGDVLRIGFGIYQDEERRRPPRRLAWGDWRERIAEAVEANRGLLVLRCWSSPTSLNFLDRQIARHPRRADQARSAASPIRNSAGSAAPPFALLLFGARRSRSPAMPTAASRSIVLIAWRWRSGAAFTALCGLAPELRAALPFAHGRRHRRGRRRRAGLRADRRPISGRAPRARDGDLLARNPARSCARDVVRRLSSPQDRLARRVHRHGHRRTAIRAVLAMAGCAIPATSTRRQRSARSARSSR